MKLSFLPRSGGPSTHHSATRGRDLRADTTPLTDIARVLFGDYAGLPHITRPWPTVREDVAALWQPNVAPSGVLLVALGGTGRQ